MTLPSVQLAGRGDGPGTPRSRPVKTADPARIRETAHPDYFAVSHKGSKGKERGEKMSETTKMVELLPCPFCGLAPTVEAPSGEMERRGWPKGVWVVSCNTWPYRSGWAVGRTREMAVERWNERYNIPLPVRVCQGIKGPLEAIEVALGESAVVVGDSDVVSNLVLMLIEHRDAVKKHPFFAHVLADVTQQMAQYGVEDWRRAIEAEIQNGKVNARSILACELWEALEAYAKGDLDHCLQELAQCGAVVLRMMDMVRGLMEVAGDE